jgi:hypothetical protein
LNTVIVCLIGLILAIIAWFSIPYMKLNHIIVWLNRNRKISHCDWISDSCQSLLCVTKSKQYSEGDFISINTKNKLLFSSLFKIRIYVILTVKNHRFQDGKILNETYENFVISLIYKNFKWTVISVERNRILQ